MKIIPLLFLSLTAATADDCGLFPGHPLITVDHPDPLANLPSCTATATGTTITLQAPTKFDWQTFQVNAGSQLVIVSTGAAGFASFHNVTTTTPAIVNGIIQADGAFTLQQGAGGQILVGQAGRITAPAITVSTQQAADAMGYLRTGSGRFDEVPGTLPFLQVEGNLRATAGAIKLIGSRLVQIGAHGKLEAPNRKVSILAGPNATTRDDGVAPAASVNGGNNVIQHFGIARGFRVEMHAVPDYDGSLCPLGFCGDQPGLYLGGEITASQVRLDTSHPFDPAVQNYTVGSLTAVSPNSGAGFELRTARFEPQSFGDPIDDDAPVIPAPVKLPGLETGVPVTSQPLTVTYSHLNAAKSGSKPASLPAGNALAVRGTGKKAGKKTGNSVVRGSFFGVPVKAN